MDEKRHYLVPSPGGERAWPATSEGHVQPRTAEDAEPSEILPSESVSAEDGMSTAELEHLERVGRAVERASTVRPGCWW